MPRTGTSSSRVPQIVDEQPATDRYVSCQFLTGEADAMYPLARM